MGLSSTHPTYDFYLPDWVKMRDCYAGERVIKSRGSKYLKPTPGQIEDGYKEGGATQSRGDAAYEAYKDRAEFPDFTEESVEKILGLMHQKPPVIELPDEMKPLFEKATADGEDLYSLLRKINEQQLITSRLGLLIDIPKTSVAGPVMPYIALYYGEAILNWDHGTKFDGISKLNLVVLDESGLQRNDNFEWVEVNQYRVLTLGATTTNENEGVYRAGVFTDEQFIETEMIEPAIQGRTLNEIPFVFLNAKDLDSTPTKPTLLGLAEKCLAIYKQQADYKQNLFMQGQDTLVVKGVGTNNEEVLRTGAGARIDLPAEGDAKYIGVNSQGLPEQRMALEASVKEAEGKALQLFRPDVSSQESGVAMGKRVTSQTATINQMVLAGAKALENSLKYIAVWLGADPSKVKVTPNLEFVNFDLSGQDWMQIQSAKRLGLPISQKSIHNCLVDRGLSKLSYEDELKLIQQEDDLAIDEGMAGIGTKNVD